MNIRSKILLSIMAGATVSATALGALVVFNAASVPAVAAIVLGFCAIAAVVGLYVANSIVRPLNSAVDMIREMSRGHLGLKLNLNRGDEIGVMAKALDTFADTLRLSADDSERAKLLTAKASVAVDEGNAAVKRMAEVINGIKASSDNNAKIIKMVNYMAFRARLLAFNATIEAARAGEAGKGFAFVAGEVRNFAARSAAAANNITDMIEESVKEIDDGVRITEDAVKAIDKVVDCIDEKFNSQDAGAAANTGGELCAAGQSEQRSLSTRQKRYADFPYKRTYSAAALAFWAPMRTAAGADGAFTIDDCEMWR